MKPSALLTEGNVNEALRNALREAGLTPLDVAARLSVDPKTVDKWLTGRSPHPRNRNALAELVGRSENELWPLATVIRSQGIGNSEIRAVYPHRWAVPRDIWHKHFKEAEHRIDILDNSGLFLAEDADIVRLLIRKAESSVRVRLLLKDPNYPDVKQCSTSECCDKAPDTQVHNIFTLFRPLTQAPGVEARLHRTVLYSSLFQSDNQLLVNPHIYGVPEVQAPVFRLGGHHESVLTAFYSESFEQVWQAAFPWGGNTTA